MGLTLDSYYKNWKVPYEEGQKTRWGISEKYLIVCFCKSTFEQSGNVGKKDS